MKVKQTVYITDMERFLAGDYDGCFTLLDNDRMADFDGRWFVVGEININVKADLKKMTAAAVKVIEEAEQKEIAEHEVKMGLLKEKKANLLSITHQPLEAV